MIAGGWPSLDGLESAIAILDGHIRTPKTWAPRAAAIMARSHLEGVVVESCRRVGADVPEASMRSRLIIWRQLGDDAQAVEMASLAWAGLSQACHQHAYELTPAVSEIRHLLGLVAAVSLERGPVDPSI